MTVDSTDKGRGLRSLLEPVGVVATLLSVAVTLFIGFRSERNKSISLRYVGQRPLLAQEAQAQSRLRVTYDGRQVARPYMVSARLENTGKFPIEARDVEQPLTLRFAHAKVLSADISDRHPREIDAQVAHDTVAAVVTHKLLNPGDWIAFDVVLDGEPSFPVDASVRISGIPQMVQVSSTTHGPVFYPTLLSIPRPVVYVSLLLASFLAGTLVVVGVMGWWSAIRAFTTGQSFDQAAKERASRLFGAELDLGIFGRADVAAMPSRLKALLQDLRLGPTLPLELIDDPAPLRRTLDQGPDVLKAHDLDAHTAETLILTELRKQVPGAVAAAVYQYLPAPIDSPARARVRKLPFDEKRMADFCKKVQTAIQDFRFDLKPVRGWAAVDSEDLTFGGLALLFGIAAVLITGGVWRSLVS